MVWSHKNIAGLTISQQEHRIALFVDDVIIFLENLKNSIPALLNLMNMFGRISGFKVSKDKSSLMLFKSEERNRAGSLFQFKKVNSLWAKVGHRFYGH